MANIVLTRSVTAPAVFAINSLPNCVQLVQQLSPTNSASILSRIGKYKYALQCVIPALVANANGARIGEILRLRWADLFVNGMAVSKSEKNSNSRLINTFMPADLIWDMQKTAPTERVFPFRYGMVYHFCKIAGIGEFVPSRKNMAVTHLGRYQVANKANELLGEECAKEIIGHKSVNSTRHYLGKKKRKA